jgi:hypothetical protein
MKFRHNAGARLTLDDGRVALVGKEWRELPADFYQEALVRGCECDKTVIEKRPDVEHANSENAKTDFDEPAAIRAGIEKLVDRGEPGDLTGAGLPNLVKLNAICGFTVGKESMLAVWKQMQAEKNPA